MQGLVLSAVVALILGTVLEDLGNGVYSKTQGFKG